MQIIIAEANKYSEEESITLARINSLKNQEESLVLKLKDLHFNIEDSNEKLRQIAVSKDVKEREIDSLNESISSLLIENNELQAFNRNIEIENNNVIKGYIEEVNNKKQELQTIEKDIISLKDILQHNTEEYNKSVATYKDELAKLLLQERVLSESIIKLDDSIYLKTKEITTCDFVINNRVAEIGRLDDSIISHDATIKESESRISKLKEDITTSNNELSGVKKNLKKYSKELSDVLAKVEDANNRLFSIAERETKLNLTIEKIKEISAKTGVEISF